MPPNRSRSRSNVAGDSGEIALSPTKAFSYSSLDSKVDGIRLVIIEPRSFHGAVISCRLQHVTFAQKPKYEALSYAWGDQSEDERILVDGDTFEVGRNLLHALRHIRDPLKERVMWIDTICIDQKNIAERNRQLPMMPYIYQRAIQVIVSLYWPQDELTIRESGYSLSSVFSSKNAERGRRLIQQMSENEYWKRVWIIQECSLARKLRIQYGDLNLDWKRFIAELKLIESCEGSVPLKLQDQIDQKYTDGHKIFTLLESHQDALCKEPRDKIYGFIGLATDTIEGFPMDYHKTLFEVWMDAVLFKNADKQYSQHDIMQFGRLVKKLLGAPAVDHISTQLPVPNMLSLPARLVGRFVHFGPTYSEIISDLKKTASWRSSINAHIPEDQRVIAREESDFFLRSLENLEDEDLAKIASYSSRMSWDVLDNDPILDSVIHWRRTGPYHKEGRDMGIWKGDELDADSHGEPRLFLLNDTSNDETSPGRMGLAPPVALVGDFVCQVLGFKKALVVRLMHRKLNESWIHRMIVVGSAGLAKNASKARNLHDDSKFDTGQFVYEVVPDEERIKVRLDVTTAYQLLE